MDVFYDQEVKPVANIKLKYVISNKFNLNILNNIWNEINIYSAYTKLKLFANEEEERICKAMLASL